MASPHVAGTLALLASNGFVRNYTGVSGLYSTLVNSGNFGWTDESGDGVTEPLLDIHDTSVFAPSMVDTGGGTPPNQPPTASFTYSCAGLACSFTGSGSDADGTIASYAWAFGDSATGTSASAAHTYASGGTYTVTLTVTDDDGATGSSSQSVTATAPSETTVLLSGSSVSNGSRWTATVIITVTTNGSPTSTWTWSSGASGSGSCSGTPCAVSKTGIRNRTNSVTLTVNTAGGSTSFGGTKSIVVPKP